MKVFSHYEEVYFQIGVSVIGIPEFVVHEIMWYKDVDVVVKPFIKRESTNYKTDQRRVQKFSSTRPNRKKDKL